MNTQIVYVIVSSSDDIYLEQLWGSVYSLRHFHPEARVLVLADSSTTKRIKTDDTLHDLYDMITELVEVAVPDDFCGVVRSRDIKTRVRNLIDGDYLYIDTDTIISGPLDGIDRLEVKNLAMVPDLHRPSVEDHISNIQRVKMHYGMEITDLKTTYFNAGVTFVRDNPLTREFYAKWHENWLSTVKKGFFIDQSGLFYTDNAFGHIIEKLPDIYNCMGVYSAFYWADARVIHYLDAGELLPFRMLKSIPAKIQDAHGITEEVKELLLNPKRHLSVHTCFCSYYDLRVLNGDFFQLCMRTKWIRWCITKYDEWMKKRRVRKLNKF